MPPDRQAPAADRAPTRWQAPALKLLAALAVVGVLWLLNEGLVRSSVRSPRVWALTAAILVAGRLLGLLARRLRAPDRLAQAAGSLPLVLVFALLVVPSLQRDTANEALPVGLPEALPGLVVTSPSAPAPGQSATAAPSATAARPAQTTRVAREVLAPRGGHEAAGHVAVYRLSDGRLHVRFEDADIGGTPDPQVWLVPGLGKESPRGGSKVGKLTAEKGTFGYTLTTTAPFAQDVTVLVWCGQFAVPIANASFAPIS